MSFMGTLAALSVLTLIFGTYCTTRNSDLLNDFKTSAVLIWIARGKVIGHLAYIWTRHLADDSCRNQILTRHK
jgi:hypothetical protein